MPTPAAQREVHSEARIFVILSQYTVMQVVLASTGLVRNKVVAWRLGPTAFGEISQVAAVMAVVLALVSFGMGVSLSRNAAAAPTDGDRQRHLANANGIVLALSCVAIVVTAALLATGRLLTVAGLSPTREVAVAAGLFVVAIPFHALQTNYLALLQGILDVRGLAVGRSVAVLAATVVSIPVVWWFGFIGAAVQALLLAAFVTVLLGWRCHRIGYQPLAVRLDRGAVVVLASFGIASMIAGAAQGLSDAAVRTALIERAGAAANGLLQAPYVLAMSVKTIVLASVGSVSLATVAATRDRAEISRAIDRLLNVVIPVGAAALGLLGLLGVPAMVVLYSRAFTGGAAFFPYMLTSDLLLVFAWVVGAPLLAAGDRVLWLALDLVHAFARWALTVLLLPELGALGVVVALLAAVALHVALNLVVFRARYHLQLRPAQLRRLVAAVALVAALSIAGWRGAGSVGVLAAALAVWLAYAVQHAREAGMVAALQRLRAGVGSA